MELGADYHDLATFFIAHGPRPQFEMEQVLPGQDSDDPFDDPITQANDLKEAGERAEAIKILMDLCQADLRCLDAHSHLGNLVFDHYPQDALRHYEAGLRIGELSLGKGFTGVLQWGNIDNRPFLRCMHGYGLCLWRLGSKEKMAWHPEQAVPVAFLLGALLPRKAAKNTSLKVSIGKPARSECKMFGSCWGLWLMPGQRVQLSLLQVKTMKKTTAAE
jgi:hypothetical protein